MKIKPIVKDYAISSLVTLVSVFSVTVVAQIDGINAESLQNGAIFSVILTAVRAAFKAVIEYLAGKATAKYVL